MNCIQFGDRKINFTIQRGKRKKTVAIHVDHMTTITVSAPQYLNEEKIRMIVQKKARWILDKQEQMERKKHDNPVKEFVSGESFPYLGKNYRLKVIPSSEDTETKCNLINGRFLIELNGKSDSNSERASVKKVLVDWYVEHAKETIAEGVERFAQQLGRWPRSIKIKNQKKQWGSCSGNGIVRFNWKVIMTPISVLDYVLVHELCHLFYHHHSAQFWQKVQSIIPDYKKKRDLLKECSYQMEGFN